MDNIEILEQYLTGQSTRHQTRDAFKVLLHTVPLGEQTKAMCAYSTFERYNMYTAQQVSEFEFLLKLRDLILFERRILCGDKVGAMISKHGAEIGLYLDGNGYANVSFKVPAWIENEGFVRKTYELADFRDEEDYDIGDNLLSSAIKKYSRYKSFEQKIAIHTALNLPDGHTLLVSLPTGAGKSSVTQMVAYHTDGLTIVVVPTVALAMDQYMSAISALNDDFAEHVFYYRGGQSDEDYREIMDGIRSRKAKLLFISPEALMKNGALNKLLNKCAEQCYLRNIVIDEAHIVPDWGILFRPDFQALAFCIKRWKEMSQSTLRTYLLSATLPDDTVDTLKQLFAPDGKIIEFRCDALRREPQFYFYETKDIQNRWCAVEEAITLLPKPMIVYFLEPSEVTTFHKRLSDKGFRNVKAFTGETADAEREQILSDWKDDKFDIVLATSAFGIGVDKANVRTVIHACIPENLSRFYQEVGRAGRDGLASLSVLIPHTGRGNNGSDLEKAYSLVRGRVLRVETMVSRWRGLLVNAFTDGAIVEVDTAATPLHFTSDAAEHAGERNSTWNINLLLFLHRIHFIDIMDVQYHLDTNSYHFTIKVLKVNELNDDALMLDAINDLREAELTTQLDGYLRMKDLVQHPTRHCWGTAFQNLYPLSQTCCNGCPKHSRNSYSMDDAFRIRCPISHTPEAISANPQLTLLMGNYDSMIIRNNQFPQIDKEALQQAVHATNQMGISIVAVPDDCAVNLDCNGVVLTRDEFIFLASTYPGFFSGGVFVAFDGNEYANSAAFSAAKKVQDIGYKTLLYCSDDMYIHSVNRRITDFHDCKIRNIRELI